MARVYPTLKVKLQAQLTNNICLQQLPSPRPGHDRTGMFTIDVTLGTSTRLRNVLLADHAALALHTVLVM